MQIVVYNDSHHRDGVISLWNKVFAYSEERNRPELSLDKKVAVGDSLFWVVLDQERVTGSIMAGYDGHRGWIYSLAVCPEMRQRGHGSALLSCAEQALKKLGCVKINLQVKASNRDVLEFYTKSGFSLEESILSLGKVFPENCREC